MMMIRLVTIKGNHKIMMISTKKKLGCFIITILWNYYCKAPRMLWYTEKGADMKID